MPPDPVAPDPQARGREIAGNLAAVERRISAACRAAGRVRGEVTLIAISKTWPASDVALMHDLGVRDVGENKDADAAVKAREVPGVRWHLVGQVQTNKARSVASYAHVVHSLDRERLATALSAGAVRAGRTVDVLLQVRLDDDPGRGGAAVPDLPALADAAARLPGLRLAGVMAVAPRHADARQAFEVLLEQSRRLRRDHPQAVVVSAGMSGDLEAAVAAGATHLRVGTALFGHRRLDLR